MVIEIIFPIIGVVFAIVGILFFGFVAFYLGKACLIGFIYEIKARKYIKNKYPEFKIDYLNMEVLENSVLCELHIPQGERLFGSLKFRKGKIINELNECGW